jgi:hypothetical protein
LARSIRSGAAAPRAFDKTEEGASIPAQFEEASGRFRHTSVKPKGVRVRSIVTIIAAFVLLAGTFCGGGTPAAKPEAAKPAEAAVAAANVPAGWPAEAFAELTKAEVDAYGKVLPTVAAALKSGGFKPVQSTPADLVADMGATVEKMKGVAGVEAALKTGNMTWDAFRATTYKVMAASTATVIGMAEAMVKDMQGAEGDAARASVAKAKVVFDQVPKANKDMIFTAMDQLKPLDDVTGSGE